MLNRLRSAAKSWSFRLLLFILLLSFVFFWGTSNYNGIKRSDLLIAGKSTISDSIYAFVLNEEAAITAFGLKKNRPLTKEELTTYGVKKRVEDQMLEAVLLKEQARLLPLGISKTKLAEAISNNGYFQENGSFKKENFIKYAQHYGLTPKSLTDYYEQQEKNSQFLSLINYGEIFPQNLIQTFLKYEYQTRDVRYIALSAKDFLPQSPPGDQQLEAWFNAHKEAYKSPEYRQFQIIRLAPLSHKDVEASNQDIEDYYNKHKAEYTSKEERNYSLATFKTLEDAQQAKQAVTPNQSLFDLDNKWRQKTLSLSRASFSADETTELPSWLKKAILSLKAGEVSAVITHGKEDNKKRQQSPATKETQLYSLVQVTNVIPPKLTPLAELHDSIKNKIEEERLSKRSEERYYQINNAYLKDEPLEDIAKQYQLTLSSYEVDPQGKDRNGKTLVDTNNDNWKNLFSAVLRSDIGQAMPVFHMDDNNLLWARVTKITPEAMNSFKSVKSKIIDRWNQEQREAMLEKTSEAILNQLKDGAPLQHFANEFNKSIIRINNLERSAKMADIGVDAITKIFTTPKNGYALAPAEGRADEKKLIIFQVLSVKDDPSLIKEQQSEMVKKQLQRYFKETLLLNVLDLLQQQTPIHFNPEAYNRLN